MLELFETKDFVSFLLHMTTQPHTIILDIHLACYHLHLNPNDKRYKLRMGQVAERTD